MQPFAPLAWPTYNDEKLLERRVSFVTEGIRPDPRLLGEAKERRFFTRVIVVCLNSPDLNVSQVSLRILQGGHSVPEDAIVARLSRSLQSPTKAVDLADQRLLAKEFAQFRAARHLNSI